MSTELSNCSLHSLRGVKTSRMATAQSVLLLAVHILLISEFILAKRDYYDILGVPKDATERQIKKAFHKLALKYHPDRNKGPDAEAKFREIAEGKCLPCNILYCGVIGTHLTLFLVCLAQIGCVSLSE